MSDFFTFFFALGLVVASPFYPIYRNYIIGKKYSKTFSAEYRSSIAIRFYLIYAIILVVTFVLFYKFTHDGQLFFPLVCFAYMYCYEKLLEYFYYYKSTSYTAHTLVFDRLNKERKAELISMVVKGQMEDVLDVLASLNLSELKKIEVEVVKSRIENLKKDIRMGILTNEEKNQTFSRIVDTVIGLIKSI